MLRRFAVGLINLFLGVAELFLAVRFALLLFDANAANQFVSWVFRSSDYLMQPFRGIFPSVVIGRHHVVDFSALFAMAIYAVFAMVLVWIVTLLDPGRSTVVKKK